MLYALETPALGGETAFANQILAYDELSVGMKRLLDDLTAEHSAEDLARLYGADVKEAMRAEHPVVRVHEDSGARALYICRAFTRRFKDWTRAESKALLDYLYEHSVRPEFQARHQWRPNDLVMWDNRCVLHRARPYDYSLPRVMRHVRVAGDRRTEAGINH